MTWSIISADFTAKSFTLAFDEALAWFRSQDVVSQEEFDALSEDARARALMIANVTQMSVVNDVFAQIDRAIAEGITFAEFRASVEDDFLRSWTGSPDAAPARLELIWQNHVQTAYNAGRYAQMTDPAVLAARPYWAYDTVADDRQSKICQALNKVVLPANAEFFQVRWPPLHHACRTSVVTLSQDAAEARGITKKPPEQIAQDGFGKTPAMGTWKPQSDDFLSALWEEYEAKMK